MATVRLGTQGTYNSAVGVKLDIDDAIHILPLDDVPVQKLLSSEPTNSIKVEWLEEELMPSVGTVSSVAGTSSPWVLTMASGHGARFRVGDILTIRGRAYNLQFRVTVVATDDVTVAGFGSTAATDDPIATDVVEVIGQVRDEGADPEAARSIDRDTNYNYTQIQQEAVQVTRTQRERAMYGVGDPYDHEVMKKFKELAIRKEKALVSGVRYTDSAKLRSMGGLFYFITTNSESGTVSQVRAKVNALIRKTYDAGGNPKVLMCSPAVRAAVSDNWDPTLRRTTRSDTVGGYTIESIVTDFGTIRLETSRHFPATKALLLQTEFDKRRVFTGTFHEMLAKTGDGDKGQLVCEDSLQVKNEKAQGVLTLTDAV